MNYLLLKIIGGLIMERLIKKSNNLQNELEKIEKKIKESR